MTFRRGIHSAILQYALYCPSHSISQTWRAIVSTERATMVLVAEVSSVCCQQREAGSALSKPKRTDHEAVEGHGFRGSLRLSGRYQLRGQLGGLHTIELQPRSGPLVQDLPPHLAQLGVDHLSHQFMGEAIAARSVCSWSSCCLLAQHPALDGFL